MRDRGPANAGREALAQVGRVDGVGRAIEKAEHQQQIRHIAGRGGVDQDRQIHRRQHARHDPHDAPPDDVGRDSRVRSCRHHHRVGARDVPAHALHVHAEIFHQIAGQPRVRAVVAELQRDRRHASTAGTCAAAADRPTALRNGLARLVGRGTAPRAVQLGGSGGVPQQRQRDDAGNDRAGKERPPAESRQQIARRAAPRSRIPPTSRPAACRARSSACASARIRPRAACRCCTARRFRIPRRSASPRSASRSGTARSRP